MENRNPVSSTEIKRIDETLTALKISLNKKASKNHLESELKHQDDKFLAMMRDIDHIKKKLDNMPPHSCFQVSRLQDFKEETEKNSKDIKRLYVWLSGVGFSLLLLFLTLGVAALRLVDRVDFSVERNTETIRKIETKLERQDAENEKIIRDTIIDTLVEVSNRKN